MAHMQPFWLIMPCDMELAPARCQCGTGRKTHTKGKKARKDAPASHGLKQFNLRCICRINRYIFSIKVHNLIKVQVEVYLGTDILDSKEKR